MRKHQNVGRMLVGSVTIKLNIFLLSELDNSRNPPASSHPWEWNCRIRWICGFQDPKAFFKWRRKETFDLAADSTGAIVSEKKMKNDGDDNTLSENYWRRVCTKILEESRALIFRVQRESLGVSSPLCILELSRLTRVD